MGQGDQACGHQAGVSHRPIFHRSLFRESGGHVCKGVTFTRSIRCQCSRYVRFTPIASEIRHHSAMARGAPLGALIQRPSVRSVRTTPAAPRVRQAAPGSRFPASCTQAGRQRDATRPVRRGPRWPIHQSGKRTSPRRAGKVYRADEPERFDQRIRRQPQRMRGVRNGGFPEYLSRARC